MNADFEQNQDLIRAARLRVERMNPISDEFELNRLLVRAAEIEDKIYIAVNGEKIRFEFQRSDCLKAIAQLALTKLRTT